MLLVQNLWVVKQKANFLFEDREPNIEVKANETTVGGRKRV